MTEVHDFATLARQLLQDYDTHDPGTAFARGLRLSIAEAYRLQDQVARLREQRGERVVGYKIGCVCAENQEKNGLTHPVYGRLWSTEQYAPDVTLVRRDFANVAVEAEYAFVLGQDLEPADRTPSLVASKVSRVFPVIELHNLRLHSGDPRGPELIANNAIHAGVVASPGVEPPVEPVSASLSLTFDGRVMGQWSDRVWPDDVLLAVPWLVAELAQTGQRLERGQTILAGAWGPPVPIEDSVSTERVDAVSTHFGTVRAMFVD